MKNFTKIETRIFEDKTIIPSKIIAKENITDGTIMQWTQRNDGEYIIKFITINENDKN